MQDCDESVI